MESENSFYAQGVTDLEITYTPAQNKIFWEDKHLFKVIPKGRRCGFTHGSAHFLIERMLERDEKILWVDTIHPNIERYVDRYFMPILKNINRRYWNWSKQSKELKLLGSYVDFRSADRPENIEGFGYTIILLNEAGIILKGERGRYLWQNAILPMTMDYAAEVIIGGTPKERTDKKTNADCLYYSLSQRGESSLGENDAWITYRIVTRENPFLTVDAIETLERELPPSVRKQELEGLFVDHTGETIFEPKWWGKMKREQLPTSWDYIVQSWDTAFKDGEEHDYSVCETWMVCQDRFILIDYWRGQVNFPELKRMFSEQYSKHNPDNVLIEDKASGTPLIQELQENTVVPVTAIQPGTRDKYERAVAVTPQFESGNVYILDDEEFTSLVINEHANFPESGRDTVDTTSQMLNYYRGNADKIPTISTRPRASRRIVSGF